MAALFNILFHSVQGIGVILKRIQIGIMKKLVLFLFLSTMAGTAFSQKIYFAYLQSDDGSPFYARMNDKVYSSSSAGYLILSRLRDSVYTIYIGFPGKESGENRFNIAVNHKDQGFLLKSFGEKGWGLFNLQDMSVQMSSSPSAAIKTVDEKDVSDFTEILSRATDDPSLKQKTVVVEKEKPAIVQAVQKEEVVVSGVKEEGAPVPQESKASEPVTEKIVPTHVKQASEKIKEEEKEKEEKEKQEEVVTAPVKEEEVKEELPKNTGEKKVEEVAKAEPGIKSENGDPNTVSRITRQSEKEKQDGHELVFLDISSNGEADTIRIEIPNQKPVVTPQVSEKKEEVKFIDFEKKAGDEKSTTTSTVTTTEKPVEEKKEVIPTEVEDPPAKKEIVACTKTAEESDFLKARRKMVSADSDDEMVMEARKYFKETCFTVYQVRNLGNLFLTDEGKYKLYDAAYAHIADPHNFISLKLELKDAYWVKRFEAMLR
jgi:hypothetical protein